MLTRRPRTGLWLHEEILLLALKDEKGTVEWQASSSYVYALAGAVMAELLLAGRITVDHGKKKFVNLVDGQPFGEPVIDECLARLNTARRRRQMQDWVSRFARLRDLKHRVAAGLCERGVLAQQEDTVLFVFHRRTYPERRPGPEQRMIERLRQAIFTDQPRVDSRTSILVSLAHGADLLCIPFAKKELRPRRKRIEQIANGDLVGRATRQAIEAMQAAILVCCVMPAITAATT